MLKYKLIKEKNACFKKTVYRIKALRDFNDVKKGDLGGFVEHEGNLSHEGNCWIYDNARVYDNAMVYDNAEIRGSARIYNQAQVFGYAQITDNATVCEKARIHGGACVFDKAKVTDNAIIYGTTVVYNNAIVDEKKCIGSGFLNTNFIQADVFQLQGCTMVTVLKTDKNIFLFNMGKYSMTKEQFKKYISDININSERCFCKYRYLKILDMYE